MVRQGRPRRTVWPKRTSSYLSSILFSPACFCLFLRLLPTTALGLAGAIKEKKCHNTETHLQVCMSPRYPPAPESHTRLQTSIQKSGANLTYRVTSSAPHRSVRLRMKPNFVAHSGTALVLYEHKKSTGWAVDGSGKGGS